MGIVEKADAVQAAPRSTVAMRMRSNPVWISTLSVIST